MQCIFDYCKADLSGELFVVAYYATFVSITVASAQAARSRSIRRAASIIAGAWLIGILSYFALKIPGHYAVAFALPAGLALNFRRAAATEIFSAPLYLLQLVQISFLATALTFGVSTYWTLFGLNRLFELTLLYVIGCSVFRMAMRRRQEKSGIPLTGWRANFVAG